MLSALTLLGACWRPDPWTPPPPPPEAVEAMTPVWEDEGDDTGGEAEGDTIAEAPEGGGEPEEEAPPPIEPWRGRLLQAPVTLVDDMGRPLTVVASREVVVEVRAEEPHRLKVWCGACEPPTEGWIQAPLVGRIE